MKNKKIWLAVSVLVVLGLLIGGIGCAQEAAPAPAPGPAKTVTKTVTVTKTPAAAAPEVYKFRMVSLYAAGQYGYTHGIVYEPDFIRDATNGRVEVTTFGSGELAPPGEYLDGCGAGMYEMVDTTVAYNRGTEPFMDCIASTAMTFRDVYDFMHLAYDRGLINVAEEVFNQYNCHTLGPSAGDAIMVTATKPLRTAADFKGLKIRAYGPFTDYLAYLDAAPTYIAMGEIFTALQTGVVDAVLTGAQVQRDNKTYEVCGYGIDQYFIGMTANECFVNLDAWNELPADLQAAMTAGQRNWAEWHSRNQTRAVETAKMDLAKAGMELIAMAPEEWEKMVAVGKRLWTDLAAQNDYSARGVKIIMDWFREDGYIK